ncbi:MAG: hypothetical protein NE330_12140 [Lentisphaeraceae bacterium]|nr:hypothetical protein [Lentisphaeraceae bacterium]
MDQSGSLGSKSLSFTQILLILEKIFKITTEGHGVSVKKNRRPTGSEWIKIALIHLFWIKAGSEDSRKLANKNSLEL